MARWLVCLGALWSCAGSTKVTVDRFETHPFYGIEVRTPRGAQFGQVDSVLPGPGGLGGSPVGERPVATITAPEPHRYHVQITKTREQGTLVGEQSVLTANHVGDPFVGRTTAVGWDLDYVSGGSKVHEIHADLAGQHFNCIFSEANGSDVAAAEAICRSMKARQ